MHNVVADKDGGQGLVEMIQNIENPFCTLVSVIRITHHPDTVHGRQRSFAPCKISAAYDQADKENDQSYGTASAGTWTCVHEKTTSQFVSFTKQ